jgi:hypothetical protein
LNNRRGGNFVEVVPVDRLPHELPHALIQRPLRYEVGIRAEGSTDTLVLYRRPFPKYGRSGKAYLDIGIWHGHRFFQSRQLDRLPELIMFRTAARAAPPVDVQRYMRWYFFYQLIALRA